MHTLGLFTNDNMAFIRFCRENDIRWAAANKHIPEAESSLDVVYTSHMVEHLHGVDVLNFLSETLRILRPGGILRVAVPDLRYHVNRYLESQDADDFISSIYMSSPKIEGVRARVRSMIVGERQHVWMYDGASMCRLLTNFGFVGAKVMAAGQTTIRDPGPLNLSERAPESVFVEARKPDSQ